MFKGYLTPAMAGFVGAALFAGLETTAFADVRMVVDSTVETGEPGVDSGSTLERHIVAMYRGNWARIEVKGEPVRLYDLGKSLIYTLDMDARTYTVQSIKKAYEQVTPPVGAPANLPIRWKSVTRIDLKAGTSKEGVVGKSSTLFTVRSTVKLAPEMDGPAFGGGFPGGGGQGGPGGGGFPGGGFPGGGPGGGGFPGGGFPGGGPGGGGFPGGGFPGGGGGGFPGGGRPGGQMPTPSLNADGEFWLTKEITTASLGVRSTSSAILPLIAASLPDDPMTLLLIKPLSSRLSAGSSFPLRSKLKIVTEMPKAPQGAGTSAGQDAIPPSTITTTVKSIEDKELDSGLFQAPADFRNLSAEVNGDKDRRRQ